MTIRASSNGQSVKPVFRAPAALVVSPTADGVLRIPDRDSLAAWIKLYGTLEAGANAGNTVQAKAHDLKLLLDFFMERVRSDHPDQWTKSVTAAFVRDLEHRLGRKPTTVNRVLATLRHCASWIDRHRPFLAGNPTAGIRELTTDEPEWKGLSDTEVMRLKSAAEQLLKLKVRRNQMPIRDYAVFLMLLNTGLRVSELVALDRGQYRGKHLHDVKRKGRIRTRQVFIPREAREALDQYLAGNPGASGPLFCSRSGRRLDRQHIDRLLRQLAAQANTRLPEEDRIRFSAHVLRHTFLRKVAQEHGIQFAMESAGHTSSKYIFRYVKPSEAEKEQALDNLF